MKELLCVMLLLPSLCSRVTFMMQMQTEKNHFWAAMFTYILAYCTFISYYCTSILTRVLDIWSMCHNHFSKTNGINCCLLSHYISMFPSSLTSIVVLASKLLTSERILRVKCFLLYSQITWWTLIGCFLVSDLLWV